jgi:hypothetical protein
VHHPIPPSIAPLVPYVVALIDLDCGVRMPTRLVDVAPSDVVAGMRVEVRFEDITDDISLALFVPSEPNVPDRAADERRSA